MNTEVAKRMRVLIQALHDLSDPRLAIPTPAGGLQVTVGWQGRVSDQALVNTLKAAGLQALALSSMYLGQPSRQGLVLGIGLTPVEAIGPAVAALGRVLESIPLEHGPHTENQ